VVIGNGENRVIEEKKNKKIASLNISIIKMKNLIKCIKTKEY